MHIAGGQGLPLYAHLFLMADGRVFFSGGRMDDGPEIGPCILDLTHDPVPAQHVANLFDGELRNQSASVLLAPAQDQRVMIIGGGPEGKPDKTHATDRINVVDLAAAVPAYTEGPPLGLGRMHLNTVLLPDRTVFASGGSLKQESEPLARLQAEIYEPDTDAWRLMATATVPRLYHSTALLLPDARVVAAGGNPEGGASVTWLPPDPNQEMRLEVFSPPYLFRGTAPDGRRRARRMRVRGPHHDHHRAGRADPLGQPGAQRRHHPFVRQQPAAGRRPDQPAHRRHADRHHHRKPRPRTARLVHALPGRPAGGAVRGALDPPDLNTAPPAGSGSPRAARFPAGSKNTAGRYLPSQRWMRRSEQAQFLWASHGVASTVGAELAVDHPLVGLHRVDRQIQLGGDLGVGHRADEVAQNELLAVGHGATAIIGILTLLLCLPHTLGLIDAGGRLTLLLGARREHGSPLVAPIARARRSHAL